MKVVIETHGSWLDFPDEFMELYGNDDWTFYEFEFDKRTTPLWVEFVETHPDIIECNTLAIIDVPDNATDWCVISDEWGEYIIAVVDGKIIRMDKDGTLTVPEYKAKYDIDHL